MYFFRNYDTFDIRNNALDRIYFHDLNTRSGLTSRRKFKKFLFDLFTKERFEIERIDIIFCSDEYLLSLNRQFLNHNYYTDTLSFPLSSTGEMLIGEIYISVDRIRSQSKNLKIRYQDELVRVIIHGCLHLCGYLDNPEKSQLKMKDVQEIYHEEWLVLLTST